MGIDHDMMPSCLGHCVEIVVVHPLPVMMLPERKDVAHVSALHCVVAILVHKVVCGFHVPLVIPYG